MISINGDLLVPQRFAIDWYALDDQHRSWVGDPSKLTSYLTYLRPVVAAADGVVVSARNDVPETTSIPNPPPVPPITETVGNAVILRVAPGAFLLHGHMVPGSVRVRPGQRVKRGDVLGLIGSSGNSSTPHLHFQVLTTPTFFPADSTPFVFDRFELVGQITEADLGRRPRPPADPRAPLRAGAQPRRPARPDAARPERDRVPDGLTHARGAPQRSSWTRVRQGRRILARAGGSPSGNSSG